MCNYQNLLVLGDSFSEGVGDYDPHAPNRVYGWADRVAHAIAKDHPQFQYANHAIRGRKIQAIIDEQIPHAITMQPELISITGGGNDLIRPKVDIDQVIALFDQAITTLSHMTTSKIMVFTYSELPNGFYSTILRGRYALFNEYLRELAEKHSLILIDWWRMYPHYRYDAYWSDDKIHMSTLGHIYLAHRVLETLGYLTPDSDPVPDNLALREFSSRFMYHTAAPWISRRLRRVSSGDRLTPKYPQFTTIKTIH